MKCTIRAVALTAALFGAGSVTQAGMITGSQGVAVVFSKITANSGNNVATATVFSNMAFSTTASQTGDYDGFSIGETFAAVNLDLSNIAAFSFGDSAFGNFTATSIVDGGFNAATNSRSFLILGTFNPGTAFPTLTENTAQLSISFTQVGGATSSISLSGTLTTPAPTPAPEPSTIVMLGTIAAPLAFGAWRRRRAKIGS